MKIRKATVNEDLPRIVDLIKQHHFTIQDSRTSGFYNWFPEEEHLIRLIENNPLCSVAYDNNELAGFLTAADNNRLRKMIDWKRDKIPEFIMQTNVTPYIYVEQLAVKHPKTRQSTQAVRLMLNRLYQQAQEINSPILCVVAQSPWRNIDSERLIRRKGFVKIDEIDKQEETFGVYQKR